VYPRTKVTGSGAADVQAVGAILLALSILPLHIWSIVISPLSLYSSSKGLSEATTFGPFLALLYLTIGDAPSDSSRKGQSFGYVMLYSLRENDIF